MMPLAFSRCGHCRGMAQRRNVPWRVYPPWVGGGFFGLGEKMGGVAAPVDAQRSHRRLDPLGDAIGADAQLAGDLLGFHMAIDHAQSLALAFGQPGDPIVH